MKYIIYFNIAVLYSFEIRFLQAHPDYKEMFTKFSDIALEALPNNSEFIFRSEVMIAKFGRILENLLENEEQFMAILEPIGAHLYGIRVTSTMIEVQMH